MFGSVSLEGEAPSFRLSVSGCASGDRQLWKQFHYCRNLSSWCHCGFTQRSEESTRSCFISYRETTRGDGKMQNTLKTGLTFPGLVFNTLMRLHNGVRTC